MAEFSAIPVFVMTMRRMPTCLREMEFSDKQSYISGILQIVVLEGILLTNLSKEEYRMRLRLVKACKEYERQIREMLEEWYATGEKIIPYAIRRLDYHDFDYYCENLEVPADNDLGLVPDSTFFCYDEERDLMVGAVNIRHYLNESLLLNGGHIGDGVRPSERRKGIATKMIGLALKECEKLGIYKVLMVCDRENEGSAKSILNNGGVLQNEIVKDGVREQRYWITLKENAHYPTIHIKSRVDKAEANFMAGYNCAQSVFITYADLFGIDDETARKLSCPMGGGMGRMREVCGTVSSMSLLGGLKIGNTDPNNQDAKTASYELTRQMADAFKEVNGTMICREILGILEREESAAPSLRTEEYYASRPCARIVRSAAEILEKHLFIVE